MSSVPEGLCASCANRRVVRNTRGSSFALCELSKRDPRYPKYPPLPVLRCAGWTPEREGDCDDRD